MTRSGAKFRFPLLPIVLLLLLGLIVLVFVTNLWALLGAVPLLGLAAAFVITGLSTRETVATSLVLASSLAFLPGADHFLGWSPWVVPVIGAVTGLVGAAMTIKKAEVIRLHHWAKSAGAHRFRL